MNLLIAGALVAASSCGAMAQIAILQLRVAEGEGAVHAPGSRLTRPLVVEVSDELGRPVAGATVSFHLPDDGPGGTFTNGLRTAVDVTDANGRVVLRNAAFNRVPGRFQLRIIAVKEQSRAGTLSQQYIAETAGRAASAGHRRKWAAVALIAAAAAGGIAAGAARGRAEAPAPQTASPPPPLSIGIPTITVGKP